MSVLQSKRSVASTEFVNTARDIYIETLSFLTKLSHKYSRLVATQIAELAGEVMDFCIKANEIFPNSEANKELRKECLLKARSSLGALDNRLSICYELMNRNPQGCFEKNVSSSEAKDKLSKMTEKVGNLIDAEFKLIKGVLESDRHR